MNLQANRGLKMSESRGAGIDEIIGKLFDL